MKVMSMDPKKKSAGIGLDHRDGNKFIIATRPCFRKNYYLEVDVALGGITTPQSTTSETSSK